jgi:hypothetical protein
MPSHKEFGNLRMDGYSPNKAWAEGIKSMISRKHREKKIASTRDLTGESLKLSSGSKDVEELCVNR